MKDDAPAERTATDDRIDENRQPAAVAPATRDPNQTEPGGLPPGHEDDARSPLDPVFYDPSVKAPSQTHLDPEAT